MSVLDEASLVVIPSGYKAGKMYSQVPVPIEGTEEVVNGNFATDSDWNKTADWSIGGGVATTTGSGRMFQTNVVTNGKYYRVSYDITAYTSGSARLDAGSAGVGTARSAVGSYTEDILAGPNETLYVNNGGVTGNLSIDNVSVKELTPYGDLDFTRSTTATRVNESGLIEAVAINTPRIDYTNGCGQLLLEPQRTNSIPHNNDFNNFSSKSNVSIVSNTATSPDGTTNAHKVNTTAVSSTHYIYQANSNSGSESTVSCFAKKAEYKYLQIASFASTSQYANFDLDLGVVGTKGAFVVSTSIEDYGNGWYRCICVFDTNTLNGSSFGIADSASAGWLNGFMGVANEGIYLFGCQAELAASYPTSYIPTAGSEVTRTADSSSTSGLSSVIGQTEGTLFAEINAFEGANTDRQISLSDASTSNRVVMALLSNGTQIQFVVASSGSITVNSTWTIPTIVSGTKIAFAYKANDFKIYSNGLLIASDTSGAVPAALHTLALDRGDGADDFYGKIKQLIVFPTALTDTQLAALTTL